MVKYASLLFLPLLAQISDPPVSVYKGFLLPKDSEEYLASHGFQNAFYTIKASDLKDDLFGKLFPCPLVVRSVLSLNSNIM